jgi:hypothetical protein
MHRSYQHRHRITRLQGTNVEVYERVVDGHGDDEGERGVVDDHSATMRTAGNGRAASTSSPRTQAENHDEPSYPPWIQS